MSDYMAESPILITLALLVAISIIIVSFLYYLLYKFRVNPQQLSTEAEHEAESYVKMGNPHYPSNMHDVIIKKIVYQRAYQDGFITRHVDYEHFIQRIIGILYVVISVLIMLVLLFLYFNN